MKLDEQNKLPNNMNKYAVHKFLKIMLPRTPRMFEPLLRLEGFNYSHSLVVLQLILIVDEYIASSECQNPFKIIFSKQSVGFM